MKVLICASNYSGSWTLYQSVNDAIKFRNLLREKFNITPPNVVSLFNVDYKKCEVLREMRDVATYLGHPNRIGLIYVAGHGDWQKDRNGDEVDGMDEVLKTHYRETIVDDEISAIFSCIHETSYLVFISDTCSSGTVLDLQFTNQNCVAISSCQDYQDSLQTGDGSVMSFCLMELLKQNSEITYGELKQKLREKMSAFVGDLQKENVNVSNEELWDIKVFQNL